MGLSSSVDLLLLLLLLLVESALMTVVTRDTVGGNTKKTFCIASRLIGRST